jgi:hypothetical protein
MKVPEAKPKNVRVTIKMPEATMDSFNVDEIKRLINNPVAMRAGNIKPKSKSLFIE